MDRISLLESWYSAQCNGIWEHSYGITLDTLDNPGWTLKINLNGTAAEGKKLDRVVIERNDADWIQYWVDQKTFHAVAGAGNLGEAIDVFLGWFNTSAK